MTASRPIGALGPIMDRRYDIDIARARQRCRCSHVRRAHHHQLAYHDGLPTRGGYFTDCRVLSCPCVGFRRDRIPQWLRRFWSI
jgi:hypothetical protein